MSVRTLASFFVFATLLGCTERLFGDGAPSIDATDVPVIDVRDAAVAMAAARCDAFFECDCNASIIGWYDPAECETDLRRAVDETVARGLEDGLHYDPACVAEFIAFYTGHGCTKMSDETEHAYAEMMGCALFHGFASEGESCSTDVVGRFDVPSIDTCAADLTCVKGRCESTKGEGDPCTGWLAIPTDCTHPLFCDPSQSPARCTPLRAVGEQCDFDEWCGPEGHCVEGICVANVGTGELCIGDECGYDTCNSGGRCETVPSACTRWGDVEQCAAVTDAAGVFVDHNEECDVDEDCVALQVPCYDIFGCDQLVVSASYDIDAWARIAVGVENSCVEYECEDCDGAIGCIDGRCGYR